MNLKNDSFRYLFFLLIILNFLNYFDRYIVTSVLDPIGRDLNLNDTQLGSLASAFLIVYMCAAPFIGLLADKWSRTKIIGTGVILWSAATSATALASDYYHLFLLRALVGIGEAAYAGIGPAILSDIFGPEKRNRTFMFYYLATPVGSALGFGMGGWLASIMGWRLAFLVSGIPGIILGLVMYFQIDPRTTVAKVQDTVKLSLMQMLNIILKNKIWIYTTLSFTGYTFAMGALTHWLPTLFQRKYSMTTAESGILFGGMAVLAGIIGTFTGGIVSEKYMKRIPTIGLQISLITLCLAAPCLALVLSNTDNLLFSSIWLFLALILLFINTTPLNVIVVSCLPSAVRATGVSLNIFFIHVLGDAISPTIVGHLSDKNGGDASALANALYVTLPPLILGALILILALKPMKVSGLQE